MAKAESPTLTDEQKAVLEKRRAAFLTDPDACSPWDKVKTRIALGIDQADRGELLDGEEALQELESRLE